MRLADTFDTAVIGGGVSGSATLLALDRYVAPGFRAAVFDPRTPGPGIAYGAQPVSLLMNGPVRAMSIVPGDDQHLLRWLKGTEEPHALISRARYGQYLASAMGAVLAARPHFEHHATEIVDIERVDDAYVLSGDNGVKYRAYTVVFALGNPPPDERFLPLTVRRHAGYIGNPWQLDVAKIAGDVAIIGSRLTAFDVVSVLEERAFAGTITLISRHGIVAQLEDARVRGVDHATLALDMSSPYALLRTMRRATRAHIAAGGDWRAVAESIRPISPAIWLAWSLRERRRFLRHLQSLWMAHRYRVPHPTHEAYQRLRERGAVRIVRGRIAEAARNADGSLSMTVTRAGKITEVTASTIVNATGPNADYTHIDRPLVRNAIKRGLMRSDALRLGLDASFDLALIASNGEAQAGLLTLGPPLRGTFYECTAIPEIRRAAEKIARAIANMDQQRTPGVAL